MEQEIKRKTVHISMGFLTILLGFFPRWLAIIAVMIALFYVSVIARPNVLKTHFELMASREEDIKSGYLYGPTLYVLMVLYLVIFFDLRVAGTVFAIMAFGDGFANVIGSKYGSHRFIRFCNKSLEGSIAFIFFAFISGVLVFFWVSLNPQDITSWIPFLDIPAPNILGVPETVFSIFLISIIAGLIELSTSHILNDNISVPLVSSILMTIFLNIL